MSWHSILVGVDCSAESAHAARLGVGIADRAGVPCRLVHTVSDFGPTLSVPEAGISLERLHEASRNAARLLVEQSLEGVVDREVIAGLEVRVGRASAVLAEEALQQQANVVILGGKRHRGLARIGGSTVTHLIRRGAVPVLAVDQRLTRVRRVLVAVDLSASTQSAIEAAQHWAALFGAELRVLHATEPLPVVPGFRMPPDDDAYYLSTHARVEAYLGPLIAYPDAQLVIRRGLATAAITTEAERWSADLVVCGSHGKGWIDRFLIGSTSERLLHVLPASTLVVPAPAVANPVRVAVPPRRAPAPA